MDRAPPLMRFGFGPKASMWPGNTLKPHFEVFPQAINSGHEGVKGLFWAFQAGLVQIYIERDFILAIGGPGPVTWLLERGAGLPRGGACLGYAPWFGKNQNLSMHHKSAVTEVTVRGENP